MKLILAFMCVCVSALAAQVTLAWDANTEPDIAGYRIYFGTNGFGEVVNAGNVTNITITTLVAGGAYSFYATCYNTSGLESEPSNIVMYSVPPDGPPLPRPPTALRMAE